MSLSEPKYWQIDIENIQAGSFSTGVTNGIVDSGTSLITGPSAEIRKIAQSVGATANLLGQYTIDCALVPSLPDLEFHIDGKAWPVPGKDLVIQASGTCLFTMMGMDIPSGVSIFISCSFIHHVYLTRISPALDPYHPYPPSLHTHPLSLISASVDPW